MALSGTLNSGNYQGRYVQFKWTATQDIAKNQSTISWTLKGAGEASSSWYKAAPFSVEIAGEKVYTSSTRIDLYNGTSIASGTKVITHNTDGKKSFTVNIKAAIYSKSYNCTGSNSFTLDDIPRAATITSAINFTDEGKPQVSYDNPLGSKATVSVGIYWDGSNVLVPYETVTGTSGTKEWTLTNSQLTNIYNKMANSKKETVYYYIKTVIGGNTFYNRIAKTLTITNAAPTLTPTAVEDTDSSTDGGDGTPIITATGSNTRWIKGMSDVRYDFGATAQKGASITSYSVQCGSKTGSNPFGVLYNVDSDTIKFTVKDSRGNTATKTLTRTLINYITPTCSIEVTAAIDEGTKAKATIKASGKFFNGNLKTSGTNAITLQYRYKTSGGSWGSWASITPTKSSNTYSGTATVSNLDYKTTYVFQARLQDDLYKAQSKYAVSKEVSVKAQPVFDWDKDDFNFNVRVDNKHTDVGYRHIHGTSGTNIGFGVGGGGINRGIYDYTQEKWLFHNDGTNTHIADANNDYIYGQNKILADVGKYMTEEQTITLKEPISAQPHGIVLVFSRYNYSDTEVLNQHWCYHFVPKVMIGLLHSGGSIFPMSTSNETFAASKYLYFTDTTISGHENNYAIGTGATGVTYNNRAFVLRYVIGV